MALTITMTITYLTHNNFLPLTNISDEARKAKKTKEGKQFCQSQDPDTNISNNIQFRLDPSPRITLSVRLSSFYPIQRK